MPYLVATLALTILLGVSGGAVVAAPAAPCPGRYLVREGTSPLIDGGAEVVVDAVVLTGSSVAIESGCSLAPARTPRQRKGGWKVRARWARCGSFPRVRLRGTLSADCQRLEGIVTARRGRIRMPFTATPSACGDGIVDPGAGESCEPPDENACDGSCRSVAASTTTTSSIITTTTAGLPTTTGPATTTTTLPCEGQETFQVIQERIFNTTCALTACHGPALQENLDLRPGASFVNLVDVPAHNATASLAGKKRVLPGDPANSFLSQKLHGTLLPGEGVRMPYFGVPLSSLELQVIDAWIAAGAPATGTAPGAPCLP